MMHGGEVLFSRMSEQAVKPVKAHEGDAGYDLFTSEDTVLPPRSFTDVSTHIKAAIPHGFWARITSRSSTVRKHGLQVQEGIIDQGYRGELFIGVWNLQDREIRVPLGTRLAQVIFHPLVSVEWTNNHRNELPAGDRGENGFGSTGA